MRDDELMDRMLRDAMTADEPTLSPDFDAQVMRRVQPRRLTSIGRAVLGGYVVAAMAIVIWAMQGLPLLSIAGSLAASAAIAVAGGAYSRHLSQRG